MARRQAEAYARACALRAREMRQSCCAAFCLMREIRQRAEVRCGAARSV